MAYAYSDWASKATAAEQLAALKLHHAEVTLQTGPNVSADGQSVDRASLLQRLTDLEAEIERRESSNGSIAGGGFMKIRRSRD